MMIRDVAYTYWAVKESDPAIYVLFIAVYTNAVTMKIREPYSVGEKTVLEIILQESSDNPKVIAQSISINLSDQGLQGDTSLDVITYQDRRWRRTTLDYRHAQITKTLSEDTLIAEGCPYIYWGPVLTAPSYHDLCVVVPLKGYNDINIPLHNGAVSDENGYKIEAKIGNPDDAASNDIKWHEILIDKNNQFSVPAGKLSNTHTLEITLKNTNENTSTANKIRTNS